MSMLDGLNEKQIGNFACDSGFILSQQIAHRIFQVTDLPVEDCRELAQAMVAHVPWQKFKPNKKGFEIRLVPGFFDVSEKTSRAFGPV